MSTDTSTAAAAVIAPCASMLREKVMAHVHASGSLGATCDDTEIALGMSHQTTSARFTELRKACRIIDVGERRLTRTGSPAIVWFSTEPTK